MRKVPLAVNGTLMRGLELNQNLLDVEAEFVREAKTSAHYRIWSIGDRYPAMIRDENQGANVELEIWNLPPESLVKVVNNEPPGLCLGKVELLDGEWVLGVLGEPYICVDKQEISNWGGWRKYFEQK